MATADKISKAPIRMSIDGGSFAEILTLLAVIREYTLVEVADGEARGAYLWVGGAYHGNEVERLRLLLKNGEPIVVRVRSADSLMALYGGPAATAMQLVLDAACDLSGG